jgi:pimeloyl-ACP methyl ester carboxylesterase
VKAGDRVTRPPADDPRLAARRTAVIMAGMNGTALARDGTRIAFTDRGPRGAAPAIVFTSGFTASDFYWRHLLRRLEGRARLITWDLKGHGRSGPAARLDAVTVADSADDLRRVLDACEVDRAVHVAFSLGCQVILEAWRAIPDRVAALVPILGTFERPNDHLLHPRLGPHQFRAFRRVGPHVARLGLRAAWLHTRLPGSFHLSRGLGLIGRRVQKVDMDPFFAHMRRIHGRTWAHMGIAAQAHSARDLLPTITVPTLVVAGGRDTFTPHHLALHMARTIPGAELLDLPDATHTGLLEYPDEIGGRLESFLARHGLLGEPAGARAATRPA